MPGTSSIIPSFHHKQILFLIFHFISAHFLQHEQRLQPCMHAWLVGRLVYNFYHKYYERHYFPLVWRRSIPHVQTDNTVLPEHESKFIVCNIYYTACAIASIPKTTCMESLVDLEVL